MAGLKGGIKVISIYNPVTGDTVQLNNLAADSEYSADPIPTETTTGQAYGGKDHTLTINFFEQGSAARAQLRAWAENDTPVCAVGAGGQSFLLWYEPVTMLFNRGKQLSARDGAMFNTVVMSFPGETAKIQTGINLADIAVKAAGFNVGWGASDSGDMADGYYEVNAVADPFSSGVQEFTWDNAGSSSAIRLDFVFPISGVTLTARAQLLTVTTNGTASIRLLALNYVGTDVGTTVVDYEAVGVETADLTTPADTYTIRLAPIFLGGISTGTNNASFRDPGIRSDGSNAYVNH